MNKINEVDTIDRVDNTIFIVYKIATYVGVLLPFIGFLLGLKLYVY